MPGLYALDVSSYFGVPAPVSSANSCGGERPATATRRSSRTAREGKAGKTEASGTGETAAAGEARRGPPRQQVRAAAHDVARGALRVPPAEALGGLPGGGLLDARGRLPARRRPRLWRGAALRAAIVVATVVAVGGVRTSQAERQARPSQAKASQASQASQAKPSRTRKRIRKRI